MEKTDKKQGRNSRRWLVGLALVALLLGGATFGAIRYYPHWRQERLLKQARAFLEWKSYESAALMTRRVLQADPNNIAATRLMVEIADAVNPDAALSWRRKLIALEPTRLEPRLALAEQTLQLGKPEWAQETLAAIAEKGQGNAHYRYLAGQIARASKDLAKADVEFAAAVKLEPQNPQYLLDLSVLRLTSKEKPISEAARVQLEGLLSQPALFARASRALIADAVLRGDRQRAMELGSALSISPHASFDDRLVCLGLLYSYGRPNYPAGLTRLQEEAANDPKKVYALMLWLNAHNGALLAVDWSRRLPAATLSTMPVPVALARSYASLGDWAGVTPLVGSPNADPVKKEGSAGAEPEPSSDSGTFSASNWEDFEYMRLALLARTLRQQGKAPESKQEWDAAVKAAGTRLDALSALAKASGEWGWESESNEILWMVARTSPNPRGALDLLYRRYEAARSTRNMQLVAARLYEIDPSDGRAANNLASFALILDKDAEKGIKLSEELHRREPQNPAYTATYAYALHIQGNTARALELMKSLGEDRLAQPEYAAYYGILLSAAGDREAARRFLDLGLKATLLPEERLLVEEAKARLEKPQ